MDKVFKTLGDLISYSTPYESRKYSMFTDIGNGVLLERSNTFKKYYNLIKSYVVELPMSVDGSSNNLAKKYSFLPDKLSIDLYGTPHLDWMLMYLNYFESPSAFIPTNRMRLILPKDIETVFDILRTKDKNDILENHESLGIE